MKMGRRRRLRHAWRIAVPDANGALLEELKEFLRIPSISSGGGDPADLDRAAEWARQRIVNAGGTAEIVRYPTGNPLVVGELRSAREDAPTVLIYGHYDVQSPNPVEEWTSPPFEPEIRGDRLYARGACDDKGNFYPLLYVACEQAAAGTLPVHVRVLMEGEEETGGRTALQWVADDTGKADCCIVFDSGMVDETTPAITLGVRGIVYLNVKVRTAPQNLHSGMYGGSVLNALHVLHGMLSAILPGPDGRLRDELRIGIRPPAPEEEESWKQLPPGETVIQELGGRPVDAGAGDRFYRSNWSDASVDVHGISGGDAFQHRTIVPPTADCMVSMRLAPGQKAAEVEAVLVRLLREAAPEGAEVEITATGTADPAAFDPSEPALKLAVEAMGKACGTPPLLVRSGGSIGVLAALADKGIPTVLSGFGLPEDHLHAPDESFRLESLRLGEASARELYAALAGLS
jgi:acetylornithine deacetylase/succinyl-diaminopimelate desuccinylase-like protein